MAFSVVPLGHSSKIQYFISPFYVEWSLGNKGQSGIL